MLLVVHFAQFVEQTFGRLVGYLMGAPAPGKVTAKRAQLWERRRVAVGLRVRLLRYERGLTQEELAAAAGMSRNSLLWLENGQRSLLSTGFTISPMRSASTSAN